MTKYEVFTEAFEFNPTKYKTAEDAHKAYDFHDAKSLGLFDTIEEARAFLATFQPHTYRFSHTCAQAEVYYISEGDYDEEDGEWEFICGENIYDFKHEELPSADEDCD